MPCKYSWVGVARRGSSLILVSIQPNAGGSFAAGGADLSGSSPSGRRNFVHYFATACCVPIAEIDYVRLQAGRSSFPAIRCCHRLEG